MLSDSSGVTGYHDESATGRQAPQVDGTHGATVGSKIIPYFSNLFLSVFSSQNHVLRSRAVDTLFLLSAFVPPGFAREVFNEINVFLTVWNTARGGSVRR